MATLFPTYRHLVLMPTLIIYLSLAIISIMRMFSKVGCDIANYLLFMAISGITTWFAYRAKKAAIRDGGIYRHTVVWLHLHDAVLLPWGSIMFFGVMISAFMTSFTTDPMPLWQEYIFRVVGKSNSAVDVISSVYWVGSLFVATPCSYAAMVPWTLVCDAEDQGLLKYSKSGGRGASNAGDLEAALDKEGQV